MKRRNFLTSGMLGLGSLGAINVFSNNQNLHQADIKGKYSYKREISRSGAYDIVVAGGGIAGTTAAIAGARLGAKTLLIEAHGNLGGMGTLALVNAFDGMADGEKMLVGGIMREIVEEMYDRKFMPKWQTPDFWRTKLLCPTRFNPEGLKRLLEEKIIESGVELRYFTKVVDVDVEKGKKRINGIIINNIEGLQYIPAKAFIDATGDAVLSVLAGVDYVQAGRDTEKIMPPTMCGIYSNYSGREDPQKYTKQAVEDGFFGEESDNVKYGHFVASNFSEGIFGLNAGHVFGTDATNIASLTKAMIKGRKLSALYEEFCKKYVPGYEKSVLATTGSLLGVRESRRIIGEYTLTFDDFKNRRQFPDQIAVFNKEVDIHIYEPTKAEFERKKDQGEYSGRLGIGESYGQPYSILVPKGWENLWAAGRCVSVDNTIYGSTRVMPSCSMQGQAAATAAVQSIVNGEKAYNLNTEQLIITLRHNGAYLPQNELSKTMTKN
jgi:ribulose 1,5-bisphosphate synthetase/thiazole synthase